MHVAESMPVFHGIEKETIDSDSDVECSGLIEDMPMETCFCKQQHVFVCALIVLFSPFPLFLFCILSLSLSQPVCFLEKTRTTALYFYFSGRYVSSPFRNSLKNVFLFKAGVT